MDFQRQSTVRGARVLLGLSKYLTLTRKGQVHLTLSIVHIYKYIYIYLYTFSPSCDLDRFPMFSWSASISATPTYGPFVSPRRLSVPSKVRGCARGMCQPLPGCDCLWRTSPVITCRARYDVCRVCDAGANGDQFVPGFVLRHIDV